MLEAKDDTQRIVKSFAALGVNVSVEQAAEIWSYYSDCHFANWLGVPDEDEELQARLKYIVKNQYPEAYALERPKVLEEALEIMNPLLYRMRFDMDMFAKNNGGKDWRSIVIKEPDIDLIIQENEKSLKIIWNGSSKSKIMYFESNTKMSNWINMRTDFDELLGQLEIEQS